jgi:hypothetical protein
VAWNTIASAIASGTSTSSSSSLATGVMGAAVAAGNVVFVMVAKDNVSTTDGNTNEVTSVTDTKGNTYTKALEFCNGQAAAAGGATIALYYSKLTTGLTTSDTVTANFSSAIVAKVVYAQGFSMTSTTSTVAIDKTATQADDATDPSSMALSGLTSGINYICIRCVAAETNVTTWTLTSGFGTMSNTGTTGGSATSNMRAAGEYLFGSSLTSATSNPTLSAVDCASIFVAFKEVPAASRRIKPRFTYWAT